MTRYNLCGGIEQWLTDVGWELSQSVHVLRPLQGVTWHVVWQSKHENRCWVPSTDQPCLVLRSTDLVTHAASTFAPNFCIAPGNVGDGCRLGIVPLLRCVSWCNGHPSSTLLFPH